MPEEFFHGGLPTELPSALEIYLRQAREFQPGLTREQEIKEPVLGPRGVSTHTAARPLYHDQMLIVKMKPEAVLAPAKSGRRSVASIAASWNLPMASAGLNLLSRLERGGYIRRAVSLARGVQPATESVPGEPATGPVMATMVRSMIASARKSSLPDPGQGVTILELESTAQSDELRRTLAQDPLVEYVSRVPVRYHCARRKFRKPPSSLQRRAAAQPPAAELWNLKKIDWSETRNLRGFQDADTIKVAVCDTGVDGDHPDLQSRIAGYHYLYSDSGVTAGLKDYVGHGTHVSGTIGALINNRVGINGICSCALSVYKIFSDETFYISDLGYYSYVVDPVMYHQALAACLDDGIKVINLSIGGAGEPDPYERQLFQELARQGAIAVAAMGNERQYGSPVSYPAALPDVIAVGTTKIDDRVANFSNRGSHIALCAPGVGIWSTLPTYDGQEGFRAIRSPGGGLTRGQPIKRERDYAAWDGTSMATPHVTAAVALLLANKGEMSPSDAKTALQKSADRVTGMGTRSFDSDYGAGRLNLLKLLK